MDGQLRIEQQICASVAGAIETGIKNNELPELELPEILIEIPKDDQFGDFSVNTAMKLAKQAKMNPRDIAAVITKYYEDSAGIIEKIQTAGAGFLNFYLKQSAYAEEISAIIEKKSDYGTICLDEKRTINIEYVSANPTGPLHLGNARGGCVGSVMSEVYRKAGYEVCEEFYLNDAGNQVIKFGQSLSSRYMQIFDPGYPFPEDGYHGEDITELANRYYKEHSDSLKGLSEEKRAEILAEYGLKINTENMRSALSRYGISYDVWFSETILHTSGAIQEAVEKLTANNATYEKDGAVWFKATDYGCEKDDVLIRANSIPTYFAADIAYHYNKLKIRNFGKAVNVWGADHHGHVQRLKSSLEALGIDSSRLTIILMQLVHVMRGSEAVRLSKRSGEIITLDELIEDVGVDAVRYIFNDTAPSTHMNFDMELAVKQSNENPVFYVQYAHARIKSILRSLPKPECKIDLSLLCEKQEAELMKKLCEFSKRITESAESFDPSKITRYAFELASAFHSFYNSCRCKCEDDMLSAARLTLVEACGYVLGNTLKLLGISAPEQM